MEVDDELIQATIQLLEPDEDERSEVFRAHGGSGVPADQAFRTPFELSLAAECEADLDPGSSSADLYAAYVQRLAPKEAVRRGLRLSALTMVDEFRSAIPISRAASILSSAAELGLGADDVDETLGCRALVADQSHVFFRHELLGHFLATEALVLAAADSSALVDALGLPGREDLRRLSLAVERNPERRTALFTAFRDHRFYVAAVRGELGLEPVEYVRSAIAGALADAAFAMSDESTRIVYELQGPIFDARRESDVRIVPNQSALIAAAGALALEGHFLDEIAALLDATDARALSRLSDSADEGVNAPVTAVVSASVHAWTRPGVSLGSATPVLIETCESDSTYRGGDPSAAARLCDGAGSRSWTRLYLACILARYQFGEERVVTKLLRRAWEANGYHLRLIALMMVHFTGSRLGEDTRDELAVLLNGFSTENWALQSSIVEALAACDRLEVRLPTVEELADQIRSEVLARGRTGCLALCRRNLCEPI